MLQNSDSVTTELKFLKWQPLYDTEKPFQIFINIPEDAEDKRTTNLVFENTKVQITDVRNFPKDHFSIDRHGFQYCRHPLTLGDTIDRQVVEDVYLRDMAAFLKSNLKDVDRVFFFDWRLRKNAPEVEGDIIDLNDLTSWLRPALHVHVDQSPLAVLRRIQLQFPEDADFLLRGRVRVINLWRPLIKQVEDYPLAICDGSTVSRTDFVEADHIRRHYTGSTMYLKHHDRQRFYFMSRQTKDEVLMFKIFDSEEAVPAKSAPHASFLDPSIPASFDPRQSIELRALVFSYPKIK